MEYFSKPVELGEIGYSREECQFIAYCLFVAAHELGYRLRASEEAGGDPICERPGESVVVPQIAIPSTLYSVITEREITLRPELRLTGASCIAPGSAGIVCSACKGSAWSAPVYIPISVARHACISPGTQTPD